MTKGTFKSHSNCVVVGNTTYPVALNGCAEYYLVELKDNATVRGDIIGNIFYISATSNNL